MALLEAKKLTSQLSKRSSQVQLGDGNMLSSTGKGGSCISSAEELTAMWEIRARQRGWREAGTAKTQCPVQQEDNFSAGPLPSDVGPIKSSLSYAEQIMVTFLNLYYCNF